MKFTLQYDRLRTLTTATPGEFDGAPPVPTLDIGINLDGSMSPDRLAVGLALIFSPWLAGPFQLPEPVSALTAQRVTEFFNERYVTLTSVTDRSLSIPQGTNQVTIIDAVTETSSPPTSPALHLTAFSQAEGNVSALGHHMTVASNVHHFAGARSHLWPTTLHTLGMGVLLAENVAANILLHPAANSAVPGLESLLESVGLGLDPP